MLQRCAKYVWTVVLMLIALWSMAQGPRNQIPGSNSNNVIPPIGIPRLYDSDTLETQDSVKKRKPRKPLESFFFDDSLRATRVFAWKVNTSYNDVTRMPVDTLLNGNFQLDYSFMRLSGGIGSAYLGNLGSATMPLNYFDRVNPRNFSFVNVWRNYIQRPEDILFYNARIPYSRVSYEMSGGTPFEENLFNVVLSHNISPSTSANIVYNADGTKGTYVNQRALDRYFAVSVAHTGKRYAIHGGYIYNVGEVNENGGIRHDNEVTDTVMPKEDQIDVMLKKAKNVYRSHTFWWTQSYGIPLRAQREDELTIQKIPTIYVGQSFDYTLFTKSYNAVGDTSLYKQSYVSEAASADSMAQQKIDFQLFMQLQPYNRDGILGLISAGIGMDFSAYYQRVPLEFRELYSVGGRMNRNTTYVYGGVEGKFKKYLDWNAKARYNLIGYRANDLDVEGNISLSAFTKKKQNPLTLDASVRFSLTAPDFWAQSFFSNHFAWHNSFEKEVLTQFSAKFSAPSIGLVLGGDYSITTNKVYFDANSLPNQFTGALSMLGVYLQKDFRAGGFHFNHRVLFQLSSEQEVAPVPLISAYVSYFFRFDVVKKVLNMEVGLDGRYQTKYYGFGYNPAIAQFYNQREKQFGGHPYVDAFVSAKWKRMRILIKLQHWNTNLFGNRDYFMALHYPQNRMMLKFGFSWSFYD